LTSSLFESQTQYQPLAERCRPQSLEDILGQSHLLGPGKPLQLAFSSGKPHSMILWGPPGVGKTTLARLAATAFKSEFIALSAVFSGVKDIREAMDKARASMIQGCHTILFVDEIHRFNKAQQDALLPYTESGLVTFIGATTENPSFEVNSALLSRAQVYVLKALSEVELSELLVRIKQRTLADYELSAKARDLLIQGSDGDARRLLNLLELCLNAVTQMVKTQQLIIPHEIDENIVRQILTNHLRRFDKGGDQFYDQISALHKSVRGSHPDAALYWFCRMLDGGADPRYLARRIVRMAWEDIGLADPRGIQLAIDAAATYERLGSPEGELALAQALIYLAVAAKSNAGYSAYNLAREFVATDRSQPVPLHLRNASTGLMSDLGYGTEYRYAHSEVNAYAAGMSYLPNGMPEPRWYRPVSRGLEEKIADKLKVLRELDEAELEK
jgi:putative ATPase